MTLRHLKIFVAVCEHGSTTKAAEALFIVQPTISHTIIELEKFYKVPLFERINQRLVLTDIGKELLTKAKEILSRFEDFEALATLHGKNPLVKIGASLTLGQTIIPRFLEAVQEQNYNIQPQILIRQSTRIQHELEQSTLDFGLIGGNVTSPHLKAVALSNEKFVAVCHADYDIYKEISFEQLTKIPLLIREHGSSSRDFLENLAEVRGLTFSPIMDSSNNQAIVTAIRSKLGVGFLTEGYVKEFIESGEFKIININDIVATQTNYLVIHKNKKLNSFQQQAFDIIKTLA